MSVLGKSSLILDLVAESPEAATLTSIAQRLGQPRSSVHRLLSEMVELGLLYRVGDSTYAPGPRLLRWGQAANQIAHIVRISQPIMERLRNAVGESVHLYVRQRDKRVCVAAVEGNFELRHFTEVGKPLPLSVGASGKLLLAHADGPVRELELQRAAADPVTPRAPSIADLRAQLAEILETDWTTSFGEREEGLAAAAVPIRDDDGNVIAALSISGPTARLTAARFEALRPELEGAAADIRRAFRPAGRRLSSVSRAAAAG
jgi:IclR family transcriptional regulator, acetate operon repressor